MWIKLISTEQRREMIRGKFMNRSNICLSYFPLHKNAVLIMTWYWLFGTRISLHSCRWGIPVKLWSIWGASFLTWGELWAPEVRTVQFPCMDTDWAPGRANPSIFNMKNTKPCPSVCPPRFKGSPGFIAVCSQRKRSCRDHLRSQHQTALQDSPILEAGSCIFHVLRLQLNEEAEILRIFWWFAQALQLAVLDYGKDHSTMWISVLQFRILSGLYTTPKSHHLYRCTFQVQPFTVRTQKHLNIFTLCLQAQYPQIPFAEQIMHFLFPACSFNLILFTVDKRRILPVYSTEPLKWWWLISEQQTKMVLGGANLQVALQKITGVEVNKEVFSAFCTLPYKVKNVENGHLMGKMLSFPGTVNSLCYSRKHNIYFLSEDWIKCYRVV